MCNVRPGTRSLGLTCAIAILFSLLFPNSFTACAENASVTAGNQAIRPFHFSVGDHYGVAEHDVAAVRERIIDDEELPVVFFLSGWARVHPDIIIGHRMRGLSWMEITRHYRISPRIFYMPLKRGHVRPDQPYGHAYGGRVRKDWNKIVLSDREIVDQVNLKYMSVRYNYPPERIVRLRGEGKRFPAIYDQFEKERTGLVHGNAGGNNYRKKAGRGALRGEKRGMATGPGAAAGNSSFHPPRNP